jgi:hypothetical protein
MHPLKEGYVTASAIRKIWGTGTPLLPVHHGLLDHSIFKGMIGDDDQPPSLTQEGGHPIEQGLQVF